MRFLLLTPALLATLGLLVCAPGASAAFGPFAPPNPFTAPTGAATMHGDSAQSDATPFPGPGTGPLDVRAQTLGAACPTVLQGRDGVPLALCTAITTRRPTVYELDPATGAPVASLALSASGNVFGGVYPYLDHEDRVVVFDGQANLLRVAHDGPGLRIASSIPVGRTLERLCPEACGGVVGSAPDWRGRVWFATARGVVGFVDPRTEEVQTLRLGEGEIVANSIATAPGATAIATDHALYLLTATRDGRAKIVWRAAYDRGPARKPGQLSRGTGATPTFFGPRDGARYLAITDNGAPNERLLVFDTAARARPTARGRRGAKRPRIVCDIPVLTGGLSGTENSPVGSGRSIFVASTYGYPYPAQPSGVEPARPATADFTGGMTRVDLRPGGVGCDVRWQNRVRSSAVPRLSTGDGLLYTIDRRPFVPGGAPGLLDSYDAVALDAETGEVAARRTIGRGAAADTLQLAPTIVPGRVLYQGTITGVTRVAAR
ncbi:hypothetical protein GKE82_18660 [Conexibacter sp. W3-3-2]|uniref:hypothetical protein n=1 Tax=Conexibacter sp. W3-3-2 TaxID=2675227 RepID=UPI0012B71EE5|nr:hypothetical protein [Conexibacter sp. W3-3-2]MTD46252.1 hypothetical protein [Conexibacter sp. W3-3-2]